MKRKTVAAITMGALNAAIEFNALKSRKLNPSGSFDRQGRWYPATEHECCRSIRRPSRAWPYSFLNHCRTAEHVSWDYGVCVSELRSVARRLETNDYEWLADNLVPEAIMAYIKKDNGFMNWVKDNKPEYAEILMDYWVTTAA
jgi:hypothetical protein